ncbi:MAG: dienelactone hydrolase family protein [Edaphobacter sp.]
MATFSNCVSVPRLSSISILVMILCFLVVPASSAAKPRACKYNYYQESTEVGVHSVTTEYYVPTGRGTHPLVFMLHGSAGAFSLHSNNEPLRDNFGEKTLARNCFVVVLPHYLEALGVKSLTSRGDMTSLFPALLAATSTMLSKAEYLPSIRGKTVLLFGESLGGYLSVALALQRQEVAAVSEISAGIPAGYSITRRPPLAVLISHGADDHLVSEDEAEKLKEFCIHHQIQYEMDIYPESGHYFAQATELRCIARTIYFFRGMH